MLVWLIIFKKITVTALKFLPIFDAFAYAVGAINTQELSERLNRKDNEKDTRAYLQNISSKDKKRNNTVQRGKKNQKNQHLGLLGALLAAYKTKKIQKLRAMRELRSMESKLMTDLDLWVQNARPGQTPPLFLSPARFGAPTKYMSAHMISNLERAAEAKAEIYAVDKGMLHLAMADRGR